MAEKSRLGKVRVKQHTVSKKSGRRSRMSGMSTPSNKSAIGPSEESQNPDKTGFKLKTLQSFYVRLSDRPVKNPTFKIAKTAEKQSPLKSLFDKTSSG